MATTADGSSLVSLISAYLGQGSTACRLLREKFGIEGNLLWAWKKHTLPNHQQDNNEQGAVPQTGVLDGAGQISYSFHGVGCRFHVGQQVIDVDFGPDGRHDGFDAWRLFMFAETTPFRGRFSSASDIQLLLDQFEQEGIVVRLSRSLSSHLYYFKSAVDDRTLQQWG